MKSQRIEPLVRYREAQEDERRRDSARAEERLHAQDALISTLAERIAELIDAIRSGTTRGLDGAELRMEEEHLAALHNQRLLAVAVRHELERECQREHQKLLGAHRDLKMVETLHTRAVARENDDRLKTERALVTELAVLGSIREPGLATGGAP